MKKILAVSLSLLVLLVMTAPAFPQDKAAQDKAAEELQAENAGYPLRVVAYVLHPIGYFLYRGIFKPLHSLVSSPGMREIFGYKSDFYETPPVGTFEEMSGALPARQEAASPEACNVWGVIREPEAPATPAAKPQEQEKKPEAEPQQPSPKDDPASEQQSSLPKRNFHARVYARAW